jgi:hypothetical protein
MASKLVENPDKLICAKIAHIAFDEHKANLLFTKC